MALKLSSDVHNKLQLEYNSHQRTFDLTSNAVMKITVLWR